jgi:hypothetical protein
MMNVIRLHFFKDAAQKKYACRICFESGGWEATSAHAEDAHPKEPTTLPLEAA